MLEGYVRRMEAGNVTYDYADDWEELMAEARPEIAEAVEKLREGK